MAAASDNLLSWRSLALQQLAVRAKTVTSAEGVAIALRAGNDIICEASVGAAPQVGSKVDGTSRWSARCLREAQPVSISHAGENSGRSYSAVLAPILHGGRAIGFCGAFATRADAFTPRHVRMLTAIAQSAARAVAPAPRMVPPKADVARKRATPSPSTHAQSESRREPVKPAPQITAAQSKPATPQATARSTRPSQIPSQAPAPPVVSNPIAPHSRVERTATTAESKPPALAAQELQPARQPVSSEVWTDVEEQIAAFTAHQKRHARMMMVGRSAVAALILAALGACFYPDRIEALAQPIVAKIQNSFQQTPSSAASEQVDVSGKPSAAKATTAQK